MVNEMKFYYKDYKNAIQIQGIIPAYDIDFYFSSKKQYEQFKEDYEFSQPKELKVQQALNMLPGYKKGLDKGRVEGAIKELSNELIKLNKELRDYERQIRICDLSLRQYTKGLRDKTAGLITDYEKRLKELESKGVN